MVLVQTDPYPLDCSQGEDKSFLLYLKRTDGTIYDLTECTIAAQIKDVIGILICTLQCTVVDASQGLARLTISASGSATAGKFFYDVRVTKAGGAIDFLPVSSFAIHRSVTSP